MSSVQPYKISVSESTISKLKSKLAASTFPAENDCYSSWDYGTPLSDIKRLAAYWRDHFDWKAQERVLNEKLPQFTTVVDIDGFGPLNVHFVHKKGNGEKNIPLLFCHGWPGSFLEVMKILPLLTEGKNGVSFNVVAPSLPNFGFSEGAQRTGFGTPQYAEAIHKVMLNLGYEKYGEFELHGKI
jgi:pimeloyl-ACP methyl ester carboxylesterase